MKPRPKADPERRRQATFKMPAADVKVTAEYVEKKPEAYTVTVKVTNGTVTADKETAAAGDTVTLTVEADETMYSQAVLAEDGLKVATARVLQLHAPMVPTALTPSPCLPTT
ncbi:MAG: InlB B-repeat-containing protein [Subdoligranulum sp.]